MKYNSFLRSWTTFESDHAHLFAESVDVVERGEFAIVPAWRGFLFVFHNGHVKTTYTLEFNHNQLVVEGPFSPAHRYERINVTSNDPAELLQAARARQQALDTDLFRQPFSYRRPRRSVGTKMNADFKHMLRPENRRRLTDVDQPITLAQALVMQQELQQGELVPCFIDLSWFSSGRDVLFYAVTRWRIWCLMLSNGTIIGMLLGDSSTDQHDTPFPISNWTIADPRVLSLNKFAERLGTSRWHHHDSSAVDALKKRIAALPRAVASDPSIQQLKDILSKY